MRAMILDEIALIESSPLRLGEHATPQPGPGEVRLKVRCCAICRTDLHVIEGELPRRTLPIIPGHQIVGLVDALGPGCRRLKAGQRVGVAWLRHTCGTCDFCRCGRENLCESARFTGYHADGGYAEYAVVPEEFAYEIPPVFEDVEAAPLLCAGIIGYRALKRCDLRSGNRLALYGFGSSAHVVLQIARHRGCEVYVVSRAPRHLELARSMGAVWAGGDARQMPVRADSAIIFAPAGNLYLDALRVLDRGGTVASAGIYMSPIPELDYGRYLYQERTMLSVANATRADGEELLKIAAEIPIRTIVETYRLEHANEALRLLKSGKVIGAAVLKIGMS